MNAPRLPDCFQKTPKKVTLSENGQILAVAVDSEGNVLIFFPVSMDIFIGV